MKQNVNERGNNWCFRKNVKTCLQNKKSHLMPLSKQGHFYPNFNFACKNSQVVAATCKYYCALLCIGCKPYHQVAKSSILNEAEFWDLSLKTSPCTKTSQVSCENQSCSLLLRNVVIFIERHCVFLRYILQYDVF